MTVALQNNLWDFCHKKTLLSTLTKQSAAQHEPHPKSTDRQRKRHCEHCGQTLSLKTYKRHRRLYYNTESDAWIKAAGSSLEHDQDQEVYSEGEIHNSNKHSYS